MTRRASENNSSCHYQELLLGNRYVSEIYQEIRQVYLQDRKPWVIGYSGGKDSTATVQLVWNALATLPRKLLDKPLYVISSDTLVETPVIVDYVNLNLEKLQETTQKLGLPFRTHKVRPLIKDTFWVNLIGKGYPIPHNRSRWCTDRLKIRPTNRFILEKVAQYGEVLLVLGVRKSESTTRAQVLNLRCIKGTKLNTHSTLPGAYVYTPIVELSTEDIWKYLLEVPPPWGNKNNNQYLFDLYKSAHSGECPLVIDKTTPSCGNSRFGCWVCTVVKRDHSMESLVESGEEWMRPLLEFRNYLSFLQRPEQKAKYRDHRRRSGRVHFKSNTKEIAWGQTRLSKGLPQKLLRKLLEIQLEVQKHDPNLTLISEEELKEIRRLWRTEQFDWLDQLPTIYSEVTGKHLDWVEDDMAVFDKRDRDILEKICRRINVPTELVMELLDLERKFDGMSKRSNFYGKIHNTLRKEWRSIQEIIS